MSDPKSVDEAWSDAMDDLRAVAKTEFNQQQQFNFRGVDAVVNATGPAFRAHRVKVIPKKIRQITSTEYETRGREGRPGTRMVNKEVIVEWEVRGPAGDTFTGESAGESADAGDKALTKAQSVAYRVFLLQALNLPTHDRDPDADTHERAATSADPELEAALDELGDACAALGLHPTYVAAKFYAQEKQTPRQSNAKIVRAFTNKLLDEKESM
jgi:hypothetical protein